MNTFLFVFMNSLDHWRELADRLAEPHYELTGEIRVGVEVKLEVNARVHEQAEQ